jgi:baseplate J-like protein
MPIPNPSLDDKSFQEIVEEARKKIPVYSRTWTDHNASDPGITFIEIFAWLAETQVYILNRIADKSYVKFLKLLGIKPQEAVSPQMDVTFTSRKEEPLQVPKNSRLESIGLDRRIVFETDEEINVVPIEINKVGTFSKKGFADVTDIIIGTGRRRGGVVEGYFYAFGDEPMTGSSSNSFYIGMNTTVTINNLLGQSFTVTIYLYEEGLPPVASHGTEYPQIYLSNNIVWEYLGYQNGSTKTWLPLEIIGRDGMLALTRSGRISFKLPFKEEDRTTIPDLDNSNNSSTSSKLFWIRCRLVENHYEIPPRVNNILLNTISATFGETAFEEKKIKTISDSTFEITEGESNRPLIKVLEVKSDYIDIEDPSEEEDRNVLYFLNNFKNVKDFVDTVNLTVEPWIAIKISEDILQARQELGEFTSLDDIKEISSVDSESLNEIREALKDKAIPWTKVDDFDASGPEDHHYTVDRLKGMIVFGNGIHGRMPPINAKMEVKYKFGNILEDGFAKDEISFIAFDENGMLLDVDAINYLPSTRGKGDEPLKYTMSRARSELKIPFKAVSSSDFEFITINTPGLRVARAKAFPLQLSSEGKKKNQDKEDCLANTVRVIVVPYSPSETPTPNRGFLRTVCEHVDKHRLITTKLRVTGPEYVGVTVNITITINSSSNPDFVRERVAEALDNFLSPISRNPRQNAWPFGRDVYRSEVSAVIEQAEGVECVLQIVLTGSGKPQHFENDKDGNIKINNLCLVYLKSYSINIPPTMARCRDEGQQGDDCRRGEKLKSK